MNLLKILLPCLTLVLFSCGGGKSASGNNPDASQKGVSRDCIPESDLLAGGIIGGQQVAKGDYDSKVVMMVISEGRFLCTAAAISPKVLLTAAHCLKDQKSTIVAYYPSLSCESGFSRSRDAVGVSAVYINENYNPVLSEDHADQTVGDLGLIVLEKAMPAGYSTYKILDPQLLSNDDMYLYGYGRENSSGGGAGILRKTTIPSGDYTVDSDAKKVSINQRNGKGICQGDSGGPSLVGAAGELQILGVNSYVVGPKSNVCGDLAYQTLVYSYKDWINSKLKLNGIDAL